MGSWFHSLVVDMLKVLPQFCDLNEGRWDLICSKVGGGGGGGGGARDKTIPPAIPCYTCFKILTGKLRIAVFFYLGKIGKFSV